MDRVGAYPGTFNPLTVAHLAVARAAVEQCRLDRLDLVVSAVSLAKENLTLPRLEHRVAVLRTAAATRPWLGVAVVEHQLVFEIAADYHVVVMGADKWHQVCDPRFYGDDPVARDDAIARLPEVAIAPRPPHAAPPGVTVLRLGADLEAVSATAVRAGRREWMSTEAADFDRRTGAWTEPDRYRAWLDQLPRDGDDQSADSPRSS